MRDESTTTEAAPLGVLTVEEFCRTYKMGRSKFYGELKSGRLSAKKNGKLTVVTRAEAQRWERSLPDYVPQKITDSYTRCGPRYVAQQT